MRWSKTDLEGLVTWENCDGERLRRPEEKPKSMYGWQKVDVNGRIMWESPDHSERLFERV